MSTGNISSLSQGLGYQNWNRNYNQQPQFFQLPPGGQNIGGFNGPQGFGQQIGLNGQGPRIHLMGPQSDQFGGTNSFGFGPQLNFNGQQGFGRQLGLNGQGGQIRIMGPQNGPFDGANGFGGFDQQLGINGQGGPGGQGPHIIRHQINPEQMMSDLDTDQDGTISTEEFAASEGPPGAPPATDEMKTEMFARLDQDGDGTVTETELQQAPPPPMLQINGQGQGPQLYQNFQPFQYMGQQ